jgi:hypothetical protein
MAVWFLPESPRWLVANSRDEEAKAFLTRFHGGGDPDDALVKLEWLVNRSLDVLRTTDATALQGRVQGRDRHRWRRQALVGL